MAATHEAETRIRLHGDHAVRMSLLSEEVITAAYEQALILAGALDLDEFRPVSVALEVRPASGQVLRFRDAEGRSICYDWAKQLCYKD